MYTMTFSDGTQLKNLNLNGNNWITSEIITTDTFSGKLNKISVTDGKITHEYTDQKLIQIQQHGKEYWFILADQTLEDKIKTLEDQQAATAQAVQDMILMQEG